MDRSVRRPRPSLIRRVNYKTPIVPSFINGFLTACVLLPLRIFDFLFLFDSSDRLGCSFSDIIIDGLFSRENCGAQVSLTIKLPLCFEIFWCNSIFERKILKFRRNPWNSSLFIATVASSIIIIGRLQQRCRVSNKLDAFLDFSCSGSRKGRSFRLKVIVRYQPDKSQFAARSIRFPAILLEYTRTYTHKRTIISDVRHLLLT